MHRAMLAENLGCIEDIPGIHEDVVAAHISTEMYLMALGRSERGRSGLETS